MKYSIYTENLGKQYGDYTAVSNVNLRIAPGEIYGFIGLNGDGKTSTIRMLLGLIQPTAGSCFIDGNEVRTARAELWKKVGYMVETPAHYPSLTVRENLEIMRKLRLLKDQSSVDDVMEKLHIAQYAQRKARELSLGNSQRLGIAKALLHRPEILILDEPTNALDPEGIVEIRELIKDLAGQHGTTVFISSHILGEVGKFATRIGMIHKGKLIHEIKREELEANCEGQLEIGVQDPTVAQSILRDAGYNCRMDRERLIIRDPRALEFPERLVGILAAQHRPPYQVFRHNEDLESYFLRTIQSSVA